VDPFQAKPKIPRTPESLSSNRSRPASGDVPFPTRSVSPPVPKPSSRGQDPVKCYYDCLEACRNLKKRHFHCKICDYISERLDNMKRHIPYHFKKLRKERERVPDGIKMVCHEYFTENCLSEDCSYSAKKQEHFHCKLCKSWACNVKKSYKYRLKHLNRTHSMFFTENGSPREAANDENLSKEMNKARKGNEAKVLAYPPAEADVLHSRRRRGNKRKKEGRNLDEEHVVTNNYEDDSKLNTEYLKNVGKDVRSIIQPIDSEASQEEDSTAAAQGSSKKECFEVSFKRTDDFEAILPDGQERDSTFSVTLNGDLGTILALFTIIKKSGIIMKDEKWREIISRNPNCHTEELLRSLSLLGNTRYCRKGTSNNSTLEVDSSERSTDNNTVGGDEGLSEVDSLPDLSWKFVEDFMMPLNEIPGTDCPSMDIDKILGYLSKVVGFDAFIGPEYSADSSGDACKEVCGENVADNTIDCTDNPMFVNASFCPLINENLSTREVSPPNISLPQDKGIRQQEKKSRISRTKKVAKRPQRAPGKRSRNSKKQTANLKSTKVAQSSLPESSVFQTIEMDSEIFTSNEQNEAVNIYDLFNGCFRNEGIQDINGNNI